MITAEVPHADHDGHGHEPAHGARGHDTRPGGGEQVSDEASSYIDDMELEKSEL